MTADAQPGSTALPPGARRGRDRQKLPPGCRYSATLPPPPRSTRLPRQSAVPTTRGQAAHVAWRRYSSHFGQQVNGDQDPPQPRRRHGSRPCSYRGVSSRERIRRRTKATIRQPNWNCACGGAKGSLGNGATALSERRRRPSTPAHSGPPQRRAGSRQTTVNRRGTGAQVATRAIRARTCNSSARARSGWMQRRRPDSNRG